MNVTGLQLMERGVTKGLIPPFVFRKDSVIPQHTMVISILFIAMQDLVGEDKQLEYDLAGDQQNPGEDGPREGGEMTFAAALWQQFGFGGGKARSEMTAADKEEADLSAGWCH